MNVCRLLKAKLFQLMEKEKVEEIGALRTKVKPEWGNQIRSYVLNPYQLVKDHRTDYTTHDLTGVMDGHIDGFVHAFLTRPEAAEAGNTERNSPPRHKDTKPNSGSGD